MGALIDVCPPLKVKRHLVWSVLKSISGMQGKRSDALMPDVEPPAAGSRTTATVDENESGGVERSQSVDKDKVNTAHLRLRPPQTRFHKHSLVRSLDKYVGVCFRI